MSDKNQGRMGDPDTGINSGRYGESSTLSDMQAYDAMESAMSNMGMVGVSTAAMPGFAEAVQGLLGAPVGVPTSAPTAPTTAPTAPAPPAAPAVAPGLLDAPAPASVDEASPFAGMTEQDMQGFMMGDIAKEAVDNLDMGFLDSPMSFSVAPQAAPAPAPGFDAQAMNNLDAMQGVTDEASFSDAGFALGGIAQGIVGAMDMSGVLGGMIDAQMAGVPGAAAGYGGPDSYGGGYGGGVGEGGYGGGGISGADGNGNNGGGGSQDGSGYGGGDMGGNASGGADQGNGGL
jgi:hypothetical protein